MSDPNPQRENKFQILDRVTFKRGPDKGKVFKVTDFDYPFEETRWPIQLIEPGSNNWIWVSPDEIEHAGD